MKLIDESSASAEAADGSQLLKQSALYRNFREQRDEILKHKWFLSEQAGRDVGFETALLDWMVNHRATWARRRQQA